MVNFRGMVAMASIVALMAFGTTGCDDDDRVGGGPGGSTTTTTTMGGGPDSTTTTTTSTTTTTMGAPPPVGFTCMITVGVTSNETMGSLQFNLDYTGAQPGGFEGSADSVSCTPAPAIAGAIITFNDDEPALTLRTGIISLAGFTGPTDVQTCTYIKDNGAAPVAGDFSLTLVDAASPSFTPLTPTLAVTVDSCVPGGGMPGTTTTTSTTTTSTTTTTTTGGGGGANSYIVTFQVDDAGPFGALQYNVDYTGAPGGFAGAADTVTCSTAPALAGAIVTFNDDEAASTLRTGIISLAGFAGPTNLANCVFDSTGAVPVAGDFAITVVDASTPALAPINPLPGMSISSIALVTPTQVK